MMLRELRLTYGEPVPHALADSRVLTPTDAVALVRPYLTAQTSETFLVIPLSMKYTPLGFRKFDGTLTYVPVEPADVLRTTLLANAPCVLVAHNHPSGDPTPSPDDKALTTRLVAACALLGVHLVDHIIIGHPNHYYSFKEMCQL